MKGVETLLLAVPIKRNALCNDDVESVEQMPKAQLNQIAHFSSTTRISIPANGFESMAGATWKRPRPRF